MHLHFTAFFMHFHKRLPGSDCMCVSVRVYMYIYSLPCTPAAHTAAFADCALIFAEIYEQH